MLMEERDRKSKVVRFTLPDMLFHVFEPGSDRQARLMQFLFIDVDVELLFQAIGEGGDPVIQRHGLHREHRIVEDREEGSVTMRPGRTIRLCRKQKTVACVEDGVSDGKGMDLMDLNAERVAVDEIPGVAPQFALHVVDEAGRAEEQDAGDAVGLGELVVLQDLRSQGQGAAHALRLRST